MSLWTMASSAATVYRIFADGCRETILPMFGPRVGFLVSDLKATMEDLSAILTIQKRPDERPYAEYRITDPEGNRLDLSQTKGWEVGAGQWDKISA
jgi:hypothetical protein